MVANELKSQFPKFAPSTYTEDADYGPENTLQRSNKVLHVTIGQFHWENRSRGVVQSGVGGQRIESRATRSHIGMRHSFGEQVKGWPVRRNITRDQNIRSPGILCGTAAKYAYNLSVASAPLSSFAIMYICVMTYLANIWLRTLRSHHRCYSYK